MSEQLFKPDVDEGALHRYFGVNFNNRMWEQLDNAELSPEADEQVREEAIYRAFASAYHWRQVGNPMNWGRGEHLISRTAVAIGDYPLGLRHARRYLELIQNHPDIAEDWDYAFAYEALARALAANGRFEEGREALEEARSRTESLGDTEDRQLVEGELARGPWFGIDG